MKYLSLDVGNRRVGVAFGDSELSLATPVDTIQRGRFEQDARALSDLVDKFSPAKLIVGLPRNMDGTQGTQADLVMAYANRLGGVINLPVVFWDERLTTVEATRRAHDAGARGRKTRKSLDAIAAAILLQDYMDNQEI